MSDTSARMDLAGAIADLAATRAAVDVARANHLEARDRVHALLDAVAAERTEEDGIDATLARQLYWEHSDVHVARIGPACGIYNNTAVHAFSGQTFDVRVNCCDCAGLVDVTLTSRTAVTQAVSSKYGRLVVCDGCKEKRHARARADIEEWL